MGASFKRSTSNDNLSGSASCRKGSSVKNFAPASRRSKTRKLFRVAQLADGHTRVEKQFETVGEAASFSNPVLGEPSYSGPNNPTNTTRRVQATAPSMELSPLCLSPLGTTVEHSTTTDTVFPLKVMPSVPGTHTSPVGGAPVDVDEPTSPKRPTEVLPAPVRQIFVAEVVDLIPRPMTQQVNPTERSWRESRDASLAVGTAKVTDEVPVALQQSLQSYLAVEILRQLLHVTRQRGVTSLGQEPQSLGNWIDDLEKIVENLEFKEAVL